MHHNVFVSAGTVLSVLLLAGCSLTPAAEDPVQVRLTDLDARVAKIERIIANQSLVELSQRVEALEAQARDLRGRADVQENAVAATQKQQRDLYQDLDRRLAALESGVVASGPAAGGTAAAESPSSAAAAGAAPADPQRAYDSAFAALKDARYPDAIAGFRSVLEGDPDGALAPNAQYWLGEACYVTRDYENAAAAFDSVVRRWPGSAKAPGAMLKLGYSQYELKRFDAAKQSLAQLVARYPDTEAAKLAQERMKRIIAEGH
ncbi:MAG: Cell division coordinator CpoB [Steroidobacteraceae bacterium]|nr:Cell division coordinator CpoB [Steroidobacteraceae bacterium]